MKVLIVSYNFPPFNTPGAVRVGGFAQEWQILGVDVKVISAAPQPYPRTLWDLASDVPVHHTRWIDPESWIRRISLSDAASIAGPSGRHQISLKAKLRSAYRSLSHVAYWPDSRALWFPFAIRAGLATCKGWKPDVILGSAQPFTSHLIASYLARRLERPWVAEFRDPWATNPESAAHTPRWRARINDTWERGVLTSAAEVVTVSKALAEDLGERFERHVWHIYTGFQAQMPEAIPSNVDELLMVYTGSIFPDRQDISVLFEALEKLGPEAEKIKIIFAGRHLESVRRTKEVHRLGHRVDVLPPTDRQSALRMQASADVLLAITSDAPSERGTITTKFNEYLAHAKPILVVGGDDNEAARIVQDNRFGLASTDGTQIANWLRLKLEEKKRPEGLVAMHGRGAAAKFARSAQAARYLEILAGASIR